MPQAEYTSYKALDPFFRVVESGLRAFVDGEHYFDMIADDAVFEFRYHFPGYPTIVRGRESLMALFLGYGNNINLHLGDALVVHSSNDGLTVIIEYEVHGKIIATDTPYDNRFISVVTIERRKIVGWRDYMDSLTAWMALNHTA